MFWIILNPRAGNGKAQKEYPNIKRFLKNSGVQFDIMLTKGPGDALEIARNCPLDGDAIVVAAGGDGTCNEVINGLLTHREPPAKPPLFGVLPLGRGNDFAYSAGASSGLNQALRLLVSGNTVPLDVGLVKGGFFPQGRYFVNGLGIGFAAKVGFEAAKMKRVHSALSYALGALITIAKYEPSPVLEIRYDSASITVPAAIVSIVNGRRMGGSFFMGPNALLDDGALDLCVVRHPATRLRFIKIVGHYPSGTQGTCEETTMGRVAGFELRALEGGMAAHCDGETVCLDGKKLSVRCVPAALRLIGPPSFHE